MNVVADEADLGLQFGILGGSKSLLGSLLFCKILLLLQEVIGVLLRLLPLADLLLDRVDLGADLGELIRSYSGRGKKESED